MVIPFGALAFACACPLLLAVAVAAAAGAVLLRIAFPLLQGLGAVGAVAGVVPAGPVVLFSPRILLALLRPLCCCRLPGPALAGFFRWLPMLLG